MKLSAVLLCLFSFVLCLPVVAQEERSPGATDAGVWREALVEYLGFEFTSVGARAALEEFLEDVIAARMGYIDAEIKLDKSRQLAKLKEKYAAAERQARAGVVGALEKILKKAINRGEDRAIALRGSLESVMAGVPIPAARFLGKGKPKGNCRRFAGHSYRLFPHEERLTFHMAEKYCEEQGGYLACVETREELEFLAGLCAAADPASTKDNTWNSWSRYWMLGGMDQEKEGEWYWINGAPIDPEMWHERQPSSNWQPGGENCVTITLRNYEEPVGTGYLLDDRSVGYRTGFICEWGGGQFFANDVGVTVDVLFEVDAYWKEVNKASKNRDQGLAAVEKKLVRPRTNYEKGLEAATKKLNRDLNSLKKFAIKAGGLGEAEAIEGAIGQLTEARDFPLRSFNSGDPLIDAVAFSGSYFKVVEESRPWHVARRRCVELGGRLAVVDSPAKQAFLFSLVPNQKWQYWLGATDEVKEGEWLWVNEECVQRGLRLGNYLGAAHAMCLGSKGELQADVADERKHFICEWPGYW